jgi:hypothetical protein
MGVVPGGLPPAPLESWEKRQREPGGNPLGRRRFVYNYHTLDRYNIPLASVAVLADDGPNWHPDEFRNSLVSCVAGVRFRPVKSLGFAAHPRNRAGPGRRPPTLVVERLVSPAREGTC